MIEVALDRLRRDEQSARGLLVGGAVGDKLRHLQLLRGEAVRGARLALARPLAGGRQLPPRSLGPRVGAERLEGGESTSQRLTRLAATPRPSQSLAEAEVGTRTLKRRRDAVVALECPLEVSAQARLEAGGDEGRLLARYRDFLPTLFGVSHVELTEGTADAPRRVTVERADGVKCERCWRVVPEVSRESGTEGLCPRCVGALAPAAHA